MSISSTMINFSGLRTEDDDFRILRNLIIYGICYEVTHRNLTKFNGVDMVKNWARGFLDKKGVDQYQFSGEHPYYRDVVEGVYRPLVDVGLIEEFENNNFVI